MAGNHLKMEIESLPKTACKRTHAHTHTHTHTHTISVLRINVEKLVSLVITICQLVNKYGSFAEFRCHNLQGLGCRNIVLVFLTLNLLTTTIIAPPSNASKWQKGFNSAFKGLNCFNTEVGGENIFRNVINFTNRNCVVSQTL
jgi:hypothetical protein